MDIIDVVLGFGFSMFISFLVTAALADCAGENCFLTKLVAFCSFGGSLAILIASIILMFI